MSKATCAVEGCTRGRYARGYCKPHYYRSLRSGGDPGGPEIGVRRKSPWADGADSGECWSCETVKPASEFYVQNGRRATQCKECMKAASQEWRKANPDLYRERMVGYHLTYNFGIGRDQYEALLAAQGGVCAICARRPGKTRFHVDHDHGTGAVRGLLCGGCNTSLGLFGEDLRLLARAAAYLESEAA